jgi:2'-5' RNA ligase
VQLEADLRQEIAGLQQTVKGLIEQSAASRARITWTRPDTVHLTIKFLGDIPEAQSTPLREAIEAAKRSGQPIEIPLVRFGAFPRDQAPRALWIGPSVDWEQHAEAERAGRLVSAIDEACAALGVKRDKHAWLPHLTVARVRDRERDVGRILSDSGVLAKPLSLGVLRLERLSLMKSEMRPDGPVHSELWAIPLAGSSG